MQEFDAIGEDLFNKLRGRFSNITIGDETGAITNEPKMARFFDFDYNGLGKVSVSLDEDQGLTVIFSKDFIATEDDMTKDAWYEFLKELRVFGKKRMLNFSVRDITKSNLNKRDYKFLAKNPEDGQMTESKLYGTSRISYQKVGEARIVIKHTEGINQESATGRTQKIGKIYIESADGERFRYPFKHLSGARAMARHVAEGGNTYDDFGKHIVGLSEEMAKLRKFKNYMGRSAVMAESLSEYMDVVKDRIKTVKKTIESLQKPAYYAETFAAFEIPMMEDVPADVAENWIDQLTIKQFNEELSDVFPYIYKLVSEATKATELSAEDLLGESQQVVEDVESWAKSLDNNTKKQFVAWAKPIIKAVDPMSVDDVYDLLGKEIVNSPFADTYKSWKDAKFKDVFNQLTATEGTDDYEEDDLYIVQKGDTVTDLARQSGMSVGDIIEINGLDDDGAIQAGQQLRVPGINQIGASPATPGATRGINPKDNYSKDDFERLINQGKYEDQIENSFEEMMGQFAEDSKRWKQTSMDPKDAIAKFGEKNVKIKKNGLNNGDDMIEIFVESDEEADEGNAFSGALAKARDNDEDEMKVDGKKIPVTEFILSMFDRETGKFPKGETAILTAIEKDYGEQYINKGKAFIEAITAKYEELNASQEPMIDEEPEGTVMEPTIEQDEEMDEGFDDYVTVDGNSYENEADAIQTIMNKGASSAAEQSWLMGMARTHDFYGKPENIGPALQKIRDKVDKKDKDAGPNYEPVLDPGELDKGPSANFPSMEVAMSKVMYYEPGEQVNISGQLHVRDVKDGKKIWRPVKQDEEMGESGLMAYAGKKKHGKEYMVKAVKAGREGASQEELGALKDKYSKAEKNKTTKETQDIKRLAGI